MMKRLLKGKKVYLRPPKADDFAELTAMYQANREFFHGLVQPKSDQKGFNTYLENNNKPENEYFLIINGEDDKIVGAVNLSQIFKGNFKNAYLGYYLSKEFTRQGLMTEAIELILQFAFKTIKLHRLEANVQPQNAASINVLKRAGFTNEGFSRKYLKINGRWRDHGRWAIIAEDWRKRR